MDRKKKATEAENPTAAHKKCYKNYDTRIKSVLKSLLMWLYNHGLISLNTNDKLFKLFDLRGA